MEVVTILSKLRNLYDFDERLRCYEQAFSHDEHLNPKITNSEWTIQFVKDVFESLGNPNAEQWCYNQFIKLFVDLNFDIGQVHYDKLCAWLLKDGLNIAKECIKNHSEIGPKAMEAWGIALKILGKQVLRSTETTNSCVSIFSLAIKSNNVLTIKEAYRAWKAIVTIFAKDPTWTSVEMPRDKSSRVNQSRLQLIMTALRYKKLPVEISSEVFDCWWTCCNSLGPRLVAEFEDIAHSFMRFCVGGSPNFLRSIAKFDSIFSEVSKQLEPTTHVFFVMNQKLEKSTYAQHKWNDNAHFKVRLIDLLESLLSESPALLNEPGFCCFNDPQIVKDHSVFAVQCIRHCDQRCVDAADRDSLSERISNLMCAVLEKITTKLADDDCAAQQTLFLAQFDAWLKESTLPNETLLRTFKKLQIDSIVSQIVEKASTYGKYTDKLKESLNEWKNKQFDGYSIAATSACIESMIQPQEDIEFTLYPESQRSIDVDQTCSSSTMLDAEDKIKSLLESCADEQQMNTCGYGEDGTTSGLEIDEQQKEWEDEKRTEKKEEERKQSQEGKEEAEKEEMEKEGKWTEETVSKGEETKVADKEENVEEELNEREDEEETRKSEEQETGKGGEEEEKEAEKEVEEEKKVEDNGDKEEEEKVEKEGKDEQETMKTGEEAEKEEKGEEGKKAELSMEETEKGEEDKEEALMEDVSGKEADALEEIWEANEIELVEEPTEGGQVIEDNAEPSTTATSVQTPTKGTENGSPPKMSRSPKFLPHTPSSILRKMDSPGANFKKTRRVQFKEVEPPHDKTRLGRSFSSSPYPKRHLESLDESTASSVADSPAKRPMKAFGQAWPIGSAGRSAGATPTRWSKSARQLLPIPEKVSPCKTAEYGQELQAKNGRSEVFARIKQKLDEQHDKLRREMESLLEESKKRMLDVVAEELAALDDVTAATVPVEGENHQ